MLELFLKWLFFDRGGKIYRKNEYADSSQAVSSRISTSKESVSQSVLESQCVKNQSFGCKISTNYEQPRQSVVESQ